MNLAAKIIENERKQLPDENRKLVGLRLKELVYAFPKQTLEVLHKTGVAVSTILPSPVLYAIVVKNLPSNSELREAVGQMLLEMDGYSSADGSQKWQLVGGALAAVGSVLSGIGRGQTQQNNTEADKQAQLAQQQLDLERAKRNRQMWLIIGISTVVLIAVILGIKAFNKSKALPLPEVPVSQLTAQ
jgi:hypothetical protein